MITFERDDLAMQYMPNEEFNKRASRLAKELVEELMKRPALPKFPDAPNVDFAAAVYTAALLLIQAADRVASMDRSIYQVYVAAIEECARDFRSGKTVIHSAAENFGTS